MAVSGKVCLCDNCQRVRREQDARERRMAQDRARVAYMRELGDRYRGGSARERVRLRRENPGVDFSAFN